MVKPIIAIRLAPTLSYTAPEIGLTIPIIKAPGNKAKPESSAERP